MLLNQTKVFLISCKSHNYELTFLRSSSSDYKILWISMCLSDSDDIYNINQLYKNDSGQKQFYFCTCCFLFERVHAFCFCKFTFSPAKKGTGFIIFLMPLICVSFMLLWLPKSRGQTLTQTLIVLPQLKASMCNHTFSYFIAYTCLMWIW